MIFGKVCYWSGYWVRWVRWNVGSGVILGQVDIGSGVILGKVECWVRCDIG